jgi:hypothetical protein
MCRAVMCHVAPHHVSSAVMCHMFMCHGRHVSRGPQCHVSCHMLCGSCASRVTCHVSQAIVVVSAVVKQQ